MRQQTLMSRTVIGGVGLGMLLILALPSVGLATVALQGSDEEPRKLTAADAANIEAQFGSRAAANTVPTPMFNPFEATGTVITRGSGTQPSGPRHLVTYVLDEIALPPGVPVPILGDRAPAQSVLRLTVIGGPFVLGADSFFVWLDDTPLTLSSTSPDGSSVSALITDRAVLRNGAAIAVSYGLAPERRQRLPEPLALGATSR